jgi:hypothetical protein
MFTLQPPRHIPTLPNRKVACPAVGRVASVRVCARTRCANSSYAVPAFRTTMTPIAIASQMRQTAWIAPLPWARGSIFMAFAGFSGRLHGSCPHCRKEQASSCPHPPGPQKTDRHPHQADDLKRRFPQACAQTCLGAQAREHAALFTGRAHPHARPSPCRFFSGSGADLQVSSVHRQRTGDPTIRPTATKI